MKKITNYFTYTFIYFLLYNFNSITQSSSGVSTYVAGNYLGWSSAGGPLPFQIGGTQYMSLTTGGLFGIGNTFSPNYKLDVEGGDINLNTFTNAYRIGDGSAGNSFKVLWHNGIVNNIYVGVGAGNTNATAYNTFVGYNAGFNTGNTISLPGEGTRNTFVGHLAGFSNNQGQENFCLEDIDKLTLLQN